ncbi:MAG: lysophospholipase [Oscillospiraceae bacterium]|jgi:alpha-beta hydrolase superfamily lysophospholipase|nr:lysophospholipase [Oscillospiraceae bacterium]
MARPGKPETQGQGTADIVRLEYTYPSASGLGEIYARGWMINGVAPKALVHVVHGMAEHGERYEAFARALCREGYALWAADLIGHGRSAQTDEDLGWFGESGGWLSFVNDTKRLNDHLRRLYPDIPIVLFGHSMGSFVARAYCARYGGELAGAVFCGTSGRNPATAAGILAARLMITFRGGRHRSELLDTAAFGTYNKKYSGKPRTKFDWLNTDPAQVDRYLADERCGFLFTAAGMLDMMGLLQNVSRQNWFQSVPYRLPMLLIAGEDDPVGDDGKGVRQVYRELKESGHNNTSCKIFPGMRHEILLEPRRQEVYDAIFAWLAAALPKE